MLFLRLRGPRALGCFTKVHAMPALMHLSQGDVSVHLIFRILQPSLIPGESHKSGQSGSMEWKSDNLPGSFGNSAPRHAELAPCGRGTGWREGGVSQSRLSAGRRRGAEGSHAPSSELLRLPVESSLLNSSILASPHSHSNGLMIICADLASGVILASPAVSPVFN